ncbi:integrase, partial [Bradyrhizobium sp. GCM10027634]|nr:integrase [Bradyrhizobium sp. WYCCWR 12677]
MNMETNLPYLSRDPDRHGNDRIYVRRNGKRIRIREQEGTPAFVKAYNTAVERLGGPAEQGQRVVVTPHAKGTIGWLGA